MLIIYDGNPIKDYFTRSKSILKLENYLKKKIKKTKMKSCLIIIKWLL